MILGTKNRFKRFQNKKFSSTPELQYKNTIDKNGQLLLQSPRTGQSATLWRFRADGVLRKFDQGRRTLELEGPLLPTKPGARVFHYPGAQCYAISLLQSRRKSIPFNRKSGWAQWKRSRYRSASRTFIVDLGRRRLGKTELRLRRDLDSDIWIQAAILQ
jgi:hypothetical protein